MISTLIFIIYHIIVKIMEPVFSTKSYARSSKFKSFARVDTKLLYFAAVCMISVSMIHTSYAQTLTNSAEAITLSDDLLNDPIAQDILKKIDSNKKND